MGRIKCKKCPECGLFHDERDEKCLCGKELSEVPSLDLTDDISIGDKEVIAYAQTCPRCGYHNFISCREEKVNVCYHCHKKRIASSDPISYQEATGDILTKGGSDNATNKSDPFKLIRENIEKVMESESLATTTNSGSSAETNSSTDPKPLSTAKDITLTAKREKFSFTIEAKDDEPYMLGREANQSDFLGKDERVSRKHCFIFFKDGFWYVKDNNSSNGTLVNSEYIGENGERMLKNGDELKLGHNDDSITFIITI